MNTAITNRITAANDKAQYDEYAKQLIAQKQILAYILVQTIDEFKGMQPEDVVSRIEGEPLIGVVPVEPGMTNTSYTHSSGDQLIGLNTENSEINEGMIRFDIIFYVRMKDGLHQHRNSERRAHPVLSSEQGDLLCQPHGLLTKRERFRPSKLQ